MLAAAPARGTFNLFVPALARVYVAPSLVSHYIDAHGYLPPPAFLDAVQQCPPMRSDAYRAGLRASLGDGLDELDALDRQLTDWARASGYLPPAAT